MTENLKTTLQIEGSSFCFPISGLPPSNTNLSPWVRWGTQLHPRVDVPHIRVRDTPQDSREAELLGLLYPGEQYLCATGKAKRAYFQDGWMDLDDHPSDICVYLTDPGNTSMDGVLHAAFVRALTLSGGLVLHGALFDVFGRTVLAIGKSGSGKSTLATAVVAAGGRIISDDSIVFERTATGNFRGFALRLNLSIRKGSMSLLPEPLRRQARPLKTPLEEKWILERTAFPAIFSASGVAEEIWVLDSQRSANSDKRQMIQAKALASFMDANPYLASAMSRERTTAIDIVKKFLCSAPLFQVRTGTSLLRTPAHELQKLIAGA